MFSKGAGARRTTSGGLSRLMFASGDCLHDEHSVAANYNYDEIVSRVFRDVQNMQIIDL